MESNTYIYLNIKNVLKRLKMDKAIWEVETVPKGDPRLKTENGLNGVASTERFRVQHNRTITAMGCNRSNGLGLRLTERLTLFNSNNLLIICTIQTIFVYLYTK